MKSSRSNSSICIEIIYCRIAYKFSNRINDFAESMDRINCGLDLHNWNLNFCAIKSSYKFLLESSSLANFNKYEKKKKSPWDFSIWLLSLYVCFEQWVFRVYVSRGKNRFAFEWNEVNLNPISLISPSVVLYYGSQIINTR